MPESVRLHRLCQRARRALGLLHHSLPALLLAGAAAAPATAPAQAAPHALPRPVAQALSRAQVPPSAAAFLVMELPSGRVRLAHRAAEPMNPASVTKLVTTSAALEVLGPAHTWTTTVQAEGELAAGVLNGSLVVRGGGDPKLVSERLQALVAQLQTSGLQAVRGDIVLDRSLWRPAAVNPGDFDGEPLKPYNVQPDPLLVNFHSLVLSFTPEPAQRVTRVRAEPPLAGVQVDARVPLADGPCQDWRTGLQATVEPQALRWAGSYPLACGERTWSIAHPEPGRFAARAIEAAWRGAGGGLSGRVRDATPGESAALQARGTLAPGRPPLKIEFPSVPLAEVVNDVNKFSNNVMAQQLFYTLGQRVAVPATLEASRTALLQWWRHALPASALPVLDNGSGLSRSERITAQALGDLLQRMAAGPRAAELLASLPVAGVDATMRQRATAVAGRAWLKTGSLRDVSAIAGYAQGAAGQRYAVVGLINHDNAAAARAALDALVQWVVLGPEASGRAAP